MTAPLSPYYSQVKALKDYYWSYADILRDIGINESTYDQRIMAFMALKLLIDNDKMLFNLEFRENFGLSDKLYPKYEGADTKETFLNIIKDIDKLGRKENEPLFVSHSNPKDKMKNAYSQKNIKTLKRYLTNKTDKKYISKSLDHDRYEINIANEIGYRDETEELSIDALLGELDELMKSMCEDYEKNGLLGLKMHEYERSA